MKKTFVVIVLIVVSIINIPMLSHSKVPPKNDVESFNQKALDYYVNGKNDLAIQTYKKAISINPKGVDYVGFGNVYYTLKNYTEAIRYYKKALEINPKDDIAKTNLKSAQEESKGK